MTGLQIVCSFLKVRIHARKGTKGFLSPNFLYKHVTIFRAIFSESVLKLGQGLFSPAHDKTCHNKEGGVRGKASGVSDPA